MVITRTPFRISFFGGGTDYYAWYKENKGAVLSTTIDKYCYISCRYLPPFFEYKHRIVYSKYEHVNEIDEIVHPSVRETMRFMEIDRGLELHHDGDLPARAGLGSSSSFTVGLLHALYALKGKMVSKKQLALESMHIEQNMIRENVGSQDQIAAAFGGFNKIEFASEHNIEVRPLTIGVEKYNLFQDHLMLFFSGITRIASNVAADQISQIPNKRAELSTMLEMVDEAINILNSDKGFLEFGRLMHENWKLKKSLSQKVSNPYIDTIYETAMKHGALGGKILGAGSGGFIVFFVKPEDRDRLRQGLHFLLHVPFCFDILGSQVIYYRDTGASTL